MPTQTELSIGRAYSAVETSELLSMDVSAFNKRVSEGMIKHVRPTGERRYSGFLTAKLLGRPLFENVEEYQPSGPMDIPSAGRRCVLGEIYPPASRSDSGRATVPG